MTEPIYEWTVEETTNIVRLIVNGATFCTLHNAELNRRHCYEVAKSLNAHTKLVAAVEAARDYLRSIPQNNSGVQLILDEALAAAKTGGSS